VAFTYNGPVIFLDYNERDWYRLGAWRLTGDGRCSGCGTRLRGVFDGPPGGWGPRRLPVRLAGDARD
jgi:hypothetical protein